MNTIKRLFQRKNILALMLIAAAVLGVSGLPQAFGIGSETILLALLGTLSLDTLIERLGYLDRIETAIIDVKKSTATKLSAADLFRVRSELPTFEKWLRENGDIWISAVNCYGVVSGYGRQIEVAAKAGARFRFLMVNPHNRMLMDAYAHKSYTYGPGPIVEESGLHALGLLRRLRKMIPPGAIEIRLLDTLMTQSVSVIDGTKNRGVIIVEEAGHKISSGQRIHFQLNKQSDGFVFEFYLDQFERMWQEAVPDSVTPDEDERN